MCPIPQWQAEPHYINDEDQNMNIFIYQVYDSIAKKDQFEC